MLVKVTAKGQSPIEAKERMDRALSEFRVRGVKTNIPFLLKLINHDGFDKFRYHTKFIDSEKSLFNFSSRKDRASKTLNFLAEVIVNGNSEVANRPRLRETTPAKLSDFGIAKSRKAQSLVDKTFKQILDEKGPQEVAQEDVTDIDETFLKKVGLPNTVKTSQEESFIAAIILFNNLMI